MVRNQQDFFSGLLFLIFGTAFALGAGRYDMGTASSMGPGYYPRLVGGLGMLVGLGVIAQSIFSKSEDDGRIGKWAWWPLLLIILANLFFGVAVGGLPSIGLPPLGLVIGIFVLVLISSIATNEFHPKEYLILSTALTVSVYLICVKVLSLYIPLFPQFF